MQVFYIFQVCVFYLLIFKNEFSLLDGLIIYLKKLFVFFISFSIYYRSCARVSCTHQIIITVMTSPFCPIIPSRLLSETKKLENKETIGGFERSTRQHQKTD
jgi:hypothetical protein